MPIKLPVSPSRQRHPIGSHLRVKRGAYWHHGVYIGRGRVIHYSGWSSEKWQKGPVTEVTLDVFASSGDIEVVVYEETLAKDKIVQNARENLSKEDYNLFNNNCEHFATYCVTGNAYSKQIKAFYLGGLIGIQLLDWFEG